MFTVEELDGATLVRMDDGGVNALDVERLRAAARLMRELADAPAVVLTGSGRVFSAGLDLRKLSDGGPDYVRDLLPALDEAFLAVFDHPRPVVAAINGHALAGGCVLAAACDLRLMSAGSIGVTELLVGVPFPAAVLEIVRFAFGPAAGELALTGRAMTPEQALGAGVVHDLAEPDALLATAIDRARALGRIPAAAYAMTKEQLHRPALAAIERARPSDDPRTLAMWLDPATTAAITGFVAGLQRRRRD